MAEQSKTVMVGSDALPNIKKDTLVLQRRVMATLLDVMAQAKEAGMLMPSVVADGKLFIMVAAIGIEIGMIEKPEGMELKLGEREISNPEHWKDLLNGQDR